jgi:hypothetical protein
MPLALLKNHLLFIGCNISKGFSSERDFGNFPTQSLRGQNQPQQVMFKLPPVVGFKSGSTRLISEKYGNHELCVTADSSYRSSFLFCYCNFGLKMANSSSALGYLITIYQLNILCYVK